MTDSDKQLLENWEAVLFDASGITYIDSDSSDMILMVNTKDAATLIRKLLAAKDAQIEEAMKDICQWLFDNHDHLPDGTKGQLDEDLSGIPWVDSVSLEKYIQAKYLTSDKTK